MPILQYLTIMAQKVITKIITNQNLTCFLVSSLFTSAECRSFIDKGIKIGYKKAIDNYPLYYRNNQRLILNDQILTSSLFNRIKQYLPQQIRVQDSIDPKQNGVWELRQLNSRLRFCRYKPLQYFNKHLDGIHHRSANLQSKLTFMIYLNSARDNFTGGRTLFYKNQTDDNILAEYTPHEGDLIIFDHNIWHKGEMVNQGEKYVMRSDVIYQKISDVPSKQKYYNENVFCQGHNGYVWSLLCWNNKLLISGGRDKILKVWNQTGKCIQELKSHENSVLNLQKISQNYLASCSRDKNIIIWKLINGQFSLYRKWVAHDSTVINLLRLSDKFIASGGADSKIKIFEVQTGELIKQLLGHESWVWKIVNVDQKTLASCSQDKTIRIWNWVQGKQIEKINHKSSIHSLVYQPENKCLFFGDIDGSLLCYSLKQRKLLWDIKAHGQMIRCLCIISDKVIATGSEDGWVRIWKTQTKQNIYSLKHNNFVEDLCLFKKNLISASYDGLILKIDQRHLI